MVVALPQAINQTVQKTLRSLKGHCAAILKRIEQRIAEDAANKATNRRRTTNSLLLGAGSSLAALLMLLLLAMYMAGVLCRGQHGRGVCSGNAVETLVAWSDRLGGSFGGLAGCAVAAWLVLGVAAWLSWRALPSLSKRDLRRLEEFRGYVQVVAKQENALYTEYFATLAHNVQER